METRSREATPAPASSDAPPPLPPAETLAEPPRRRGSAAVKRKAPSNPASTHSKRLIKERNALNIPSLHNGPCTRARQSPSKFAASTSTSADAPATSTSADVVVVGSAAGGPVDAGEGELAPVDEPIVDVEFDLVRSRGSNVHVVPTSAGWFSWNEINLIEKQTLTSFFNGKSESRTPEIYMEIRNSIMRKYHANPQTQLQLQDVEEIPVGDSDTKQEIMEFLDHWGLINFHPFLPENPEASKADAEEESKASLLDKMYQFDMVQSCHRFVPKKVEISPPAAVPRFVPESSTADELVGPVGPSVEYHCNSCSADCSRKRYHCQKQADFDLCAECYNNEKFGSGMSPSDFILMESAEIPGMSGGSWTDQETLLLLEALELFGENWNEIAEHVATKTKAQCILHFLQMPIEDPYLEGGNDADEIIQEHMDPGSADRRTTESEAPETKEIENAERRDHPVSTPVDDSKRKDACELEISGENGESIAIDALKAAFQAIGYMPEQEGLTSFADAGNPVMALAAYLTRLVEPDAASTSFRSSLKAMYEDSPGLQLAMRHCFVLEDPPNDTKDPPALESAANDTSNGAANDTSNGDATGEEAMAQVLSGNDELQVCMDKNMETTIPVINVQSPSVEIDKNSPIENEKTHMEIDKNSPIENEKTHMEIDKNSPIENEKISVENEKTLSEENEKMGVENEKTLSEENEKMGVEKFECPSIGTVIMITKNNENESKENEKSPSGESGESTPMENAKIASVSSQDCAVAATESSNSVLPTTTSSTKDLGNPAVQGEQLGPCPVKDENESYSPMVPGCKISENPVNPMLAGEQTCPSTVKDESDCASPKVLSSTNPKDIGELGLQGEAGIGAANEGNELKSTGEYTPDSVKDSGNVVSVDVVEQIATMVLDPNVPSEEQESKQKPSTDSTVESTERPDGDDRKASPSNNGKDSDSVGANDDQINTSVNKLKRAAVSVLSAAAVKAKLLANQEEDQIRQLVSLTIEKQLHKLETKLALFMDIESVIMRMREQTERARQRLMHERAQIIAARLGLPAPPRGNPMSLPTSKLAPAYGSSGLNPGSIALQKAQPMRRP